MNEYLVETDFLFGLRYSDRYNSKVEAALKLTKNKKDELKIGCESSDSFRYSIIFSFI